MSTSLLTLPLELIADILAKLDLLTLVNVSRVCRLLAAISRDPLLNPWRNRIELVLRDEFPDDEYRLLQNLSCISCIPRRNWFHILSVASPEFILFNDIPWLPDEIYEEAFKTRFLPSWTKWKKTFSWKRTFRMILMRIYHRLNVTCTADESWTNFVMLSRQGIVNLNAVSSRQYNPHAVMNIYKEQNDLTNQSSTTRLIVQLADVRIIAIGTIGKASSYQVNRLAKEFVHPTGVYPAGITPLQNAIDEPVSASSDTPYYAQTSLPLVEIPITRSLTLDSTPNKRSIWHRFRSASSPRNISPILDVEFIDHNSSIIKATPKATTPTDYPCLTQPRPIDGHRNFPNYTPGGQDIRWPQSYDGTTEEHWVGPLLITALLVPHSEEPLEGDGPEELMRRIGSGRSRWASFTSDDLDVLAPWLAAGGHITKRVDGMGLGN